MIIEVDIYSAIHTRYSDGESIRSFAKDLSVQDRLFKYCESDTHPEVRKNHQREPVVLADTIKNFHSYCFKEDEDEKLKGQFYHRAVFPFLCPWRIYSN